MLTRRSTGVGVLVEDDGRGFDPTARRTDSLGLVGMRERVALLGGTLTVETSPGSGTTVVGQIPAAALSARA